jgi:MFS family permease
MSAVHSPISADGAANRECSRRVRRPRQLVIAGRVLARAASALLIPMIGTGTETRAGRRTVGSSSTLTLLYAARAARGFADGFAAIILPVYLIELAFTPFQVGFIATAALLGTAVMTLGVGYLASRHDLRKLLLVSALLMIATGVAFASVASGKVALLPLIAAVAFAGTANPSSGDIGIFVPLEHAMLARDVTDSGRTRVFARYSLVGGLSTAAGALGATVPNLLVATGAGRIAALQAMFYLYGVLGLVALALYRRLPQAQNRTADEQYPQPPLGPSRGIVYRLAALFSLDAFAGGFAVQSLVALWLFERFDMSLGAASVFFFWSNMLAAFSYPVAARLSKRCGLVNTMVFTHIPSSVCLIVAAFLPDLTAVLVLLLIRAALSQMDVPTRTSYVMAVVTPAERPAAASVTAVPRSLASSISPTIAGALLSTAFSGLPLVFCGALKIVYDISLLLSFRQLKPPEERNESQA